MAKTEVCALVDLGDVEDAGQDAGGEVAGGAAAQLVGEWEDESGVDSGSFEQFELAGQRGEEAMRPFWVKDAGWVRLEGDGERAAGERAGAADDLGDDSLVAEMNAIVVADGGDDGCGNGREFGELAVDAHEAFGYDKSLLLLDEKKMRGFISALRMTTQIMLRMTVPQMSCYRLAPD